MVIYIVLLADDVSGLCKTESSLHKKREDQNHKKIIFDHAVSVFSSCSGRDFRILLSSSFLSRGIISQKKRLKMLDTLRDLIVV